MKHRICEAFCAAIEAHKVPVGWAIQTPYADAEGEPLLIYIVRAGDRWRVEDDGNQVPILEASGVDLGRRSRGAAFSYLLREFDAQFDSDERTLHSAALSENEIGPAAVRFVGLLLRLQDLALLSAPFIRNTFREDAISAIHRAFEGRAKIDHHALLSLDQVGPEADIIVRAESQAPLAIYLGTTEERALHALIAKMDAQAYRRIDSKVALIIERAKRNFIRENTLALASARLDAVLAYRGAEPDAIDRLERMAGLSPAAQTIS